MLAVVTMAAALTQLTNFGSNPGALQAYEYAPASAPANAPLVVFMHGCSQGAAEAAKVGWNQLADEYGFYVLYPQQTMDNNPIKCFNWAGEYGDPANLVRGMGENESIKQMVDKMIATHSIDPKRVYIAGFSAGGAMVSVMLATWPDRFAAGAIWSGVPYRCATTVNEAYNCQQLASHAELKKTPQQWGDLVRAASGGFAGPWPRVLIMHGTGDGIVSPDNQAELIEQWTNVHGTDQTGDDMGAVGNHQRVRYLAGGKVAVESWKVQGMGHAVAMGAGDPLHACPPMGGTYVEDRQLCAAWRAAAFFGITEDPPPESDGGVDMPGTPDGGPSVPGAPTVQIVSPASGADVSGAVTIEATASDGDGIARVEFWVDGELKGSDGTAPYTQLWQTASVAAGEHEIRAVAYDLYEVSAEDTRTVTVGGGGDGGDGAGADDGVVDPIPCGCASGGGRGAAGGALLGLLALAALLSTRRTR